MKIFISVSAATPKDPLKAYNKIVSSILKTKQSIDKELAKARPNPKTVSTARLTLVKFKKQRLDFLDKLKASGVSLPKEGRLLLNGDAATPASKAPAKSPAGSHEVSANLDEGFSTKSELQAHLDKMNKKFKTNVSFTSARKAKAGINVKLSGSKADLKKFLEGHDLDDQVDSIATTGFKEKVKANVSALKGTSVTKVRGKPFQHVATRTDGKTMEFNERMFFPHLKGNAKTAKGLENLVAGSVEAYKLRLDGYKKRLANKEFDVKFTKERITQYMNEAQDKLDANKKLAKFLGI